MEPGSAPTAFTPRRRPATTRTGWAEASSRFEAIGALGFATETAREAADANARAGDQRAAAGWARRARELSARVDGAGRRSAAGLAGADPLTRREREVAELAAEGLPSRAIGERLHVSKRTVESHVLRVYAKLGVRSRAELARGAVEGLNLTNPRATHRRQ